MHRWSGRGTGGRTTGIITPGREREPCKHLHGYPSDGRPGQRHPTSHPALTVRSAAAAVTPVIPPTAGRGATGRWKKDDHG